MKDDTELQIGNVHIKLIPMVGINFTGEGYEIFNKDMLGEMIYRLSTNVKTKPILDKYNIQRTKLLEIFEHARKLLE